MRNENIKKILILTSFFAVLLLFMGSVSAADYTLSEVEQAATGVQSYTSSHGNVPGYVDISSKNSTDQSFLYTMTKTTVKLDAGSTTPTAISSVGNPTAPSGSATGTVYRSEYVSIAKNINSFVSSNGRAPNYASSSKGNIRYESLIYMYANIIDFYRDNNRLPNYVSVTYVAGVDSTGVTIDNVAPSVSNNLASGSYNTAKSVTLTATDHVDPNPKVYYSTNGGSTWSYQTKTVTLNLAQGVTTLKYYGKDATGHTSATQTATYTIDTTAPTVTLTPAAGLHNTTLVTLTANDNIDTNPTVYYSTNGGSTWSSQAKTVTLSLVPGLTTLKYYGKDALGNTGATQTATYTIDTTLPTATANLASGFYNTSQSVTLTATDNLDPNPIIYYTTNGTDPTTSSTQYTEPISITTTTTLKFMAVDAAGNKCLIQALNYTLNTISNINTGKIYSRIQDAIDDLSTSNGDFIEINSGIYTENIVLNKAITIMPVLGANVIIQTANHYTPIIRINSAGSGSTIQGLIIKGDNSSPSIDLDGANNCNVTNNTIIDSYGLYIDYSNNNTITGNTITNTFWGIHIGAASNNIITGNTITNNANYGIFFGESNNNTIITENTITNNDYGIYNYYASVNNINFNRIFGNIRYGLYNEGNGTVNATNNWWGSNNPLISSGSPSDICIAGGTVTYNSWFSADIGFTQDQIKTAAGTIKTYIETNHHLPSSVTISGITVNMPQFLKLATTSVLNIISDIDEPIVLGNIRNTSNPTENITNGVIPDTEYVDIANKVKSFIDINKYAPNYISNISLGDSIRFESLVYMYSQILNSYNNTNGTLPDSITVTPWIAVLNPNGTYNFRTQKVFNTIQDAINDADTQNDDTITLGNKTFIENVIVNKKLTISSLSGNTTVNAANPNLPVFTIGTSGSGSIIQNLIIQGSTGNAGIYINSSNNNTISGNNITSNLNGVSINNSLNSTISENSVKNSLYNGIYSLNSSNSTISENNILNNTRNGIYLDTSNDAKIAENTISSNIHHGINIYNSLNSTISKNNILNNTLDGIYLNNSSANINFNRIVGNSNYGLENQGNGTINATNNWWGSNNNPSNKIQNAGTGNVTYDPWLVLNVTSSCDRSNRTSTTYNYIITANVTHNNQGNDTSPYDTLPNDILLFFNTNLGAIETSVSTTNGRGVATLNSTTPGIANVTTTLDNQQISVLVNVTSIDDLGIYNTRTNQGFETIHAAINDINTQSGDTITLADGTYTENVIIGKTITLTPVSGAHVILKPLYGSDPIIKINSSGSGSTISGLTLTEGSYGIYMDSVNNCNITGNSISGNFNGIYLTNSSNNSITGNTITDTGVGITYQNSNNTTITGNNITYSQIQDIQMIDTTGIVMSSTTSNCGPATLATVLQKLGINVSQDVLAVIAGTDDYGTTMYGLAQAARQQQGVIAKGLKLTVNELKPRNIVYLIIAGEKHYSIITSINGTIVYLADTDLGNINMTIENFTAAYIQNTTTGYGYALVVTNNSTDPQLNNTNTLTDDEMKTIKGTGIISDWNKGWTHPRIKKYANEILARYNKWYWQVYALWHGRNYTKGKLIFSWMKSYRIWYATKESGRYHELTKYSIDTVLNTHYANCCEQSRLIVCLAIAMGINHDCVRYVHKNGNPGHYWAQIYCGNSKNPYSDGPNWRDLDTSKSSKYGWFMDPNTWRNRQYLYTWHNPTF